MTNHPRRPNNGDRSRKLRTPIQPTQPMQPQQNSQRMNTQTLHDVPLQSRPNHPTQRSKPFTMRSITQVAQGGTPTARHISPQTQPIPRQPTGYTVPVNTYTGAYPANDASGYTGFYTSGQVPPNPPYGGASVPAPMNSGNPWAARSRVRRTQSTLLVVLGMIALGVGVLAVMALFTLGVVLSPERIADGVSIAGVDVGNRTIDEARRSLASRVIDPEIILVDVGRTFRARISELGASVDVEATLNLAKSARAGTEVTPQLRVDLARAQEGFAARTEEINIDAIPGQSGRAMEIPVMLDRLRVDVTGELSDGVFELNMIDIPPPDPVTYAVQTGQTTVHIVERGQELALIARYYGVSMQDIAQINDIPNYDLIYPGQELLIPATGQYTPVNVPPAPRSTGKSIVVDTTEQRIYAYENGQLVRSHLTSTGLPATPTVLGDYSIYVKYLATDMSGPGYYLPQVPYTMYFYQGYGIHGTYWHNSFGRPMSHGCVNLPTAEAQWFFNWAEVGTPVRVI